MGRRLGRRRKRIIVTGGANGRRAFVPYEVGTVEVSQHAQAPEVSRITEQEARALIEKIVWPNGPKCPACGNEGHGSAYDLGGFREGRRKCKRCYTQFTTTSGTTMASTKLRMKDWVRAIDALAMNPDLRECEFVRILGGVGYKSAGIIRKRLLVDEPLLRRYRQYMERARA